MIGTVVPVMYLVMDTNHPALPTLLARLICVALAAPLIVSPAQADEAVRAQVSPTATVTVPDNTGGTAKPTSTPRATDPKLLQRLKKIIEDLKHEDADAQGCMYG
jgi:hypothetical protein